MSRTRAFALNCALRAPINEEMGPHGPHADELRLMRRAAMALFAAGAVVCAVGVTLKALSPMASSVQLGSAVGFAICAAAVFVAPPHRRLIEAAAAVSIGLLCTMLATSNVIGMTPFFFLWPLVFLAHFSARRTLVAAFVLMAAGVAAAAAVNPHATDKLDTVIGTVSSVGLMAGLIQVMSMRERQLRAALARAANTDALTGLLNRRAFDPELAALATGAAAATSTLSVVMFDLDHFKDYNDRHGHLVGDEALCRVACVLTRSAGPRDLVARLGGEEFAVALPGSGPPAARAFAEQVVEALRREDVPAGRRLTVSAGIASRSGTCAPQDLLRDADSALYAAKRDGRDRAATFAGERRQAA
ncbi:MAG: diguanylate cyclase [Baekduia sp.]|nr:diguanylate cyclase [Baekduia sp.]